MSGSPLVLLVDDDHDSREVVSELLKEFGYAVIESERGDDALEQVLSKSPAILLLDVTLPGLSGIEVVKRMKADPRMCKIPVIAFTGHGLDPEERKHFDAVAMKPANFEIVFDTMARLLGQG
jgi:CheY-like chemotaxis protein